MTTEGVAGKCSVVAVGVGVLVVVAVAVAVLSEWRFGAQQGISSEDMRSEVR